MTDTILATLEDLNRRAQLALQRENRSTAQERWRELLDKVPAPQDEKPLPEPASAQHVLAAQACFSLQQSLDEADNELEDDDEDKEAEGANTRPEQIALLRRALSHAQVLYQPTTAQSDLEAGLIRATLASLLLPTPPTSVDALPAESAKELFDLALQSIKSASTKRKNELLTALRPTAAGQSNTNKKESQDIAGSLQVIYDAPSSHFIHLAQDLPLEELDALAKSIHAFFDDQVPGSMGALGKAETALNMGEVLVDKIEDEEEDAESGKGDPRRVEQIKDLARGWLQQAVKLFEQAQSQAPASQTDELNFQLGHALSLLHDVTPSESHEAHKLAEKMEALGISVDDDEWEDEEDED